MKLRTALITVLCFVSMHVFAQDIPRAVPGEIETYIDRFSIDRVGKNQNG